MRWCKVLVPLLLSGPLLAAEGYVIGVGAEFDNESGQAFSLSGDLGLTEKTWVSASVARSSVELQRDLDSRTNYANVGIDHWFDPVGVRLSLSYWGDSDVLESDDLGASLYWRGDRFSLSGDLARRDFSFDIFRSDRLPGQSIEFHADGVGLSGRFELSDSVDVSFSGIDYDYNVNLRLDPNRPILDFLSASRLSLINSLIDYRASVGLGIQSGERQWSLGLATWRGEADGSRTNSASLRFLTPMSRRSDIEFGVEFDDSDDYGSATLFSVFIYFYG